MLLHAGELIHSELYVCRALRQYRAWAPQVLNTYKTQVAYASCHFARRDATAYSRCQDWVFKQNKGLTNLGGVGLVMNYWPENTKSANAMCK